MIRIFLSTKSASLQSLFAKDDNPIERAKVDALTIDQINNFIALSHNGEIVNDNTVSQIFLLFDGLESIPTGLVIDKVNDYLLYHNATKEGIKNSFTFTNSSSHSQGADSLFRTTFKVLFDDKVADKINKLLITVFPITQKEYFERKKTDFLYSIYNGKTPTEFPKEVTPSDEVTKLHKHFTEHKYDKQLDFDDDESKGAEQRQKLSLLRDALLANK